MKLKYIFISLSIGLTFISLFAGFSLYQSIFGIGFALLISAVFEILRLSSLYSIKQFNGLFRYVVTFLYILIAGTCFTASVLSFNSKIIKNDDEYKESIRSQMQLDIHDIKEAYAKNINIQIEQLENNKVKIKTLSLAFPNNKTYQFKLDQYDERIAKLKEQENEYFSQEMNSPDWISNQKAILGLPETKVYKNLKSPLTRASKESIGIDESQLQKWFGFILTLIVEIGIVLLAVLGMSFKDISKVVAMPQISTVNENPERKKRGRSIIPKG